ncbi:MAG TPA: hypothetical protein VMV56_07485 [Williamwhitmania sp.]|nr:hypothetical protein [Williamwhitmania sp.]
MNNELEIEVFITKTKQFRARIKESKNAIPYEVTIGGDEWNKGKGKEYESAIKIKCHALMLFLGMKYDKIFYSV